MTIRIRRSFLCALTLLGTVTSAAAQNAPAAGTKPAGPATPPSADTTGTGPSSMGSSGWTGGTGGSHIGTANQASTPGSKSEQPETVQGLNPSVSGDGASRK